MSDTHFLWPYELVPKTEALTSLSIDGHRFVLNGRYWHAPGFTDFASLYQFVQTGQLDPLATDLQQTLFGEYRDGTRVVCGDFVLVPRILCMAQNLFKLTPADALAHLDAHATLMNQHRMVPMYVLLADTSGVPGGWSLSPSQCQDFVNQACAILSKHICLVSLVNEWGVNQYQPIDPATFSKPGGVLISRGSAGAGDYTHVINNPDPWDWAEFHGVRDANRDYLRDTVKVVRDLQANWGGPIMDSEPPKVSDNPNLGQAEINNTDETFFRGQAASGFAKGGVFHSANGLESQPLSDIQKNCWITWLRGFVGASPYHV